LPPCHRKFEFPRRFFSSAKFGAVTPASEGLRRLILLTFVRAAPLLESRFLASDGNKPRLFAIFVKLFSSSAMVFFHIFRHFHGVARGQRDVSKCPIGRGKKERKTFTFGRQLKNQSSSKSGMNAPVGSLALSSPQTHYPIAGDGVAATGGPKFNRAACACVCSLLRWP
jgi:hypothetical protein